MVNLDHQSCEVERDMSNEMTAEQADLFESMTGLQQRMSAHVLAGMKPSEAHYEAGGTCNNELHRRKLARQILSNPTVKKFLDSFSYNLINESIMSREEMMERLSNLGRVGMSDIIEFSNTEPHSDDSKEVEQSTWKVRESAIDDPDIMSSISEVTAGAGGLKIKQHSPLAAMKQLADLAGYNKPQQIEQSGVVAQVQMSKEEYAEVRAKMLLEDDC